MKCNVRFWCCSAIIIPERKRKEMKQQIPRGINKVSIYIQTTVRRGFSFSDSDLLLPVFNIVFIYISLNIKGR